MDAAKPSAGFVLVHGGGSSWDWHLVTPRLREHGHDVIAVDLPFEEESHGVSEYADAVVAECRGRSRLAVVARSFGGLGAPVVCSRIETELLVLVNAMIPAPGETGGQWWITSGHAEHGAPMSTEQETSRPSTTTCRPSSPPNRSHRNESGPAALTTLRRSTPGPRSLRDTWRAATTTASRSRSRGPTPPPARGSPPTRSTAHMVALSRPEELADRLHRYWTELPGWHPGRPLPSER